MWFVTMGMRLGIDRRTGCPFGATFTACLTRVTGESSHGPAELLSEQIFESSSTKRTHGTPWTDKKLSTVCRGRCWSGILPMSSAKGEFLGLEPHGAVPDFSLPKRDMAADTEKS